MPILAVDVIVRIGQLDNMSQRLRQFTVFMDSPLMVKKRAQSTKTLAIRCYTIYPRSVSQVNVGDRPQ